MNSGTYRHTDPHFLIQDQALLAKFLRHIHIHPSLDHGESLLLKLCPALARIPYENLTKIIKSGNGIYAGNIKRLPDEVLRDFLQYGTGGTCFSLTAAFVAIFSALGIETHPILADRHYGPDTHCALLFWQEAHALLLDPGYLIHRPIPLPIMEPVSMINDVNTIELVPHTAGRTVELVTIVNNNRRSRLTYKVSPVDGPTFGRAWERSFTWEMMTYPVLTRCHNGTHHYLQGDVLRTRTDGRTTRQKLSPDQEYDFISNTLGLHPTIIKKALTVMG